VTGPTEGGAPGAGWDCHIHVYPADATLAATAPNTPPAGADAAAFSALRGASARALVVQPSHYGRDNAATLAAAARLGGRAVIVVGAGVGEATLAAATAAGAVGARFHMARAPAVAWHELPDVAARIAPFGWAVHVQMAGPDLAAAAPVLAGLPCPVVIEHFGRPARPDDPGDPAVRAVLGLLEGGKGWVKLSAGYTLSPREDPADPDVARLAERYARAAPGRILWGSNWPHPNRERPPPPDAAILAATRSWFGVDEALLRALLVENPAALFGLAGAAPPA
jgi:D-galactarolactone isomerase